MKKRGVSEVLTVVLLIGIVLVSFLIVYNVTIIMIKSSTKGAEASSNSFIRALSEWTSGGSGNQGPAPANLSPHLDGTIEACYLGLEINETKVGEELDENGSVISQDIEFGLLNQSNLYGYYESSINNYDSEMGADYKLLTYDSYGNVLSNYSLYSGRFVFYDSFDETTNEPDGGILEINSSTLSEVIYYDERIASIKIDNNGTVTNLNINPSEFECVRTCKIENENLGDDNSCCIGFIAGENEDGLVCVNPNDGVCSEFEDADSCIGDCFNSTRCLYEGCMNFSCFNDDYIRNVSACSCDLKPLCHIADINGNGAVDYPDYVELMRFFSTRTIHGVIPGEQYSCGYVDINRDGVVDSFDYNILMTNWNATTATPCRQEALNC